MAVNQFKSDREYLVGRSKPADADVKVSLTDFKLPEEVINFPRESEIPPGYYFSEIIDVVPRVTGSGKKCLDVYYELLGFREGEYKMKLSYPEGSRPLHDLYRAMRKAGVPGGKDMSAAIGVTEKIRLVYDEEGGIGRIDARVYDPVEEDADEPTDQEEEG